MFECHGWAVIRSTTSDVEPQIDDDLAERLRVNLEDLSGDPNVAWRIYTRLNGTLSLMTINGHKNHRREAVIDIFRWLAENGPGSYGLLYVLDDEDHKRGGSYENEFRVWRLARGILTEHADPFLSPCIPTIEDPYDREND